MLARYPEQICMHGATLAFSSIHGPCIVANASPVTQAHDWSTEADSATAGFGSNSSLFALTVYICHLANISTHAHSTAYFSPASFASTPNSRHSSIHHAEPLHSPRLVQWHFYSSSAFDYSTSSTSKDNARVEQLHGTDPSTSIPL